MTSRSAVVDKWEVYLLLSTTGQLVSPPPTLFLFLSPSLPLFLLPLPTPFVFLSCFSLNKEVRISLNVKCS